MGVPAGVISGFAHHSDRLRSLAVHTQTFPIVPLDRGMKERANTQRPMTINMDHMCNNHPTLHSNLAELTTGRVTGVLQGPPGHVIPRQLPGGLLLKSTFSKGRHFS